MNQIEIDKINSKISYNEGKIYFKEGENYTSNIFESLYKAGFKTVKAGAFTILKDKEGSEVVRGISRIDMLYNLAITMR
jgi:hypothetical protein